MKVYSAVILPTTPGAPAPTPNTRPAHQPTPGETRTDLGAGAPYAYGDEDVDVGPDDDAPGATFRYPPFAATFDGGGSGEEDEYGDGDGDRDDYGDAHGEEGDFAPFRHDSPLSATARSAIGQENAVVDMPGDSRHFMTIAARYDVRTMTGTDAIRFANDLIASGIDHDDALAVTWPITCRNLLSTIGKEAAAPKVETWDDVVRFHRARRDFADRRRLRTHSADLDRLIALAEVLYRAARVAGRMRSDA
jgi:hypothetical protein